MRPADNPLGAVNDTLLRVFGLSPSRHQRGFGRQVTPWGLVDSEGTVITGTSGDLWTLRKSGRSTVDVGTLSFSLDSTGHRHVLERLPQLGWCMPSVRDRTASAPMRDYTPESAAEVLDALVPDPNRRVPTPDLDDLTRKTTTTVNSTPDATAVRVLARQLGIGEGAEADLTLPTALSHLAADCVALAAKASELRAKVFVHGDAPGYDELTTTRERKKK